MNASVINTAVICIVLQVVLWISLLSIGYCALKVKDNGGRFSIGMMLAVVTAVSLFCASLELLATWPTN